MATHDYVISNASGAAVRADLNNALAAIVTNNSSATAPTTTYAYQWWADTGSSPAVMKLRNAANSAWITLFQLDGEWTTLALENGTAAAPSIYFKDSGTDTGIYSPGVDQVGIATGGTNRLLIDSAGQIEAVSLGTAAAPVWSFTTDTNTGIYSPGADQLAISTNGAQRVTFDSTGRVGINYTSPLGQLEIYRTSTTDPSLRLRYNDVSYYGDHLMDANGNYVIYSPTANGVTSGNLRLRAAGVFSVSTNNAAVTSPALTIDTSNRVGIGTTSPSSLLHLEGSDGVAQIRLQRAGTNIYGIIRQTSAPYGLTYDAVDVNTGSPTHAFRTSTDGSTFSERARIDSSGRLLVGTSTAVGRSDLLQIQGESGLSTGIGSISLRRGFGPADLGSGSSLGRIDFGPNDGGTGARIEAVGDAAMGTNDYPSRLVFSTTADGASSPTERMRIDSAGSARFANALYVYPNTDNAVALGFTGNRWTAVYAANGTIQTSDEREKTQITNSSLGSDFIKDLRPVSYKWIEGGKRDTGERDEDGNYIYESVPGERTHWGFIAQEVKQAVDAAGVDFGGWVLTDKDDPDSQQALRYDQFIAPLTKALQEALAEIDVLKAKVAALEAA